MLDTSPTTIRNWEERYGVIAPDRSPGGHRLYSRTDVERLRFILAELARGLTAADAHRMLEERLEAGGGQPRLQTGTTSSRLAILVVERDRRLAELTEFFLRTEGYEVSLALDPSELAERQGESDLIILELMIAGGTGAELCRRLGEEASCPVLAISSLELRESALEAGADAFLQKPFQPLELASAVRDLLGTSAYLTAAPVEEARA